MHTYFFLAAMAFLAGGINSVAGGGTLLTFPALLAVLPSVAANATSTLALVPGALAASWGFRNELVPMQRWLKLLALPSLLGGVIGSLALVLLPAVYFDNLIPWLILTAATLFLVQPLISRWLASRRGKTKDDRPVHSAVLVGVLLFQFAVAIYGGYFGAGIGILMLSALSLMGVNDIHHMNALKSILASFINGISAVIFVVKGEVNWRYGLLMAAAAILGGYCGARVSRRLNRNVLRWMVIAIGFSLAVHFFRH